MKGSKNIFMSLLLLNFLLSVVDSNPQSNFFTRLLNPLINYETDYTVEEILRLFLRGIGLTTDKLLRVDENVPIEEDVTFWCTNSDHLDELRQVMVNDTTQLLQDKLALDKPITFIIHGWLDNANRSWVKLMTDDYITYLDVNVCIVDWHRLANYEYTIAARENIRHVAEHIVALLENIKSVGFHLDNITIVGHSLGAQVAGLVGEAFEGEISTIFGLDPAGPLFTHPIVTPSSQRLDPSDAKFVQTIYTTRNMLGGSIDMGHQNFYPNGGAVPQPSCIFPLLTNGISPESLSCSHGEALNYFRLSLNPDNVYMGQECLSDIGTRLSICLGSQRDRMGVYSNRTPGDFYVRLLLDPISREARRLFRL